MSAKAPSRGTALGADLHSPGHVEVWLPYLRVASPLVTTDFDRLAVLLRQLLEIPARMEGLAREVRELKASMEQMQRALPPMLLSIPDAARSLGVSRSTLRRRLEDGSLPYVRIGRAVRVDLAKVRPIDDEEMARIAGEIRRRVT